MGGVTEGSTDMAGYVPKQDVVEGTLEQKQKQETETPTTAIPAGGEVSETKKEE